MYKEIDFSKNRKACRNTISTFPIQGILHLNISNNNRTINLGELYLLNSPNLFKVNLDKIKTEEGITEGKTILSRLESDILFLEINTAINNLINRLLREVFIKIDLVILSENTSDTTQLPLDKIIDEINLDTVSKISKLITKTSITYGSAHTISSDICKENAYETFRKINYNNIKTPQTNNTIPSLNQILNLNFIIKEQLRVEIVNKSGVNGWGERVQKLLSNYGVNVIKITDDNQAPIRKSKIYLKETNKDSNTRDVLEYLFNSNNSKQNNVVLFEDMSSIENTKFIFSDIYIELGTDFVY